MNWVRLIFVGAVAWLGYHFGASITLTDQWQLFEALRTTTSIAFGIMAALLALVYPDAVKNALRNERRTVADSDGGLSTLVSPCAHSAILLILLVAIAPVFAWLRTFDPAVVPAHVITIQQACFSLFCVLSYWQIMILLMVLMPFDDLYSKVTHGIQRARLRRDMHSNGRG